MTTFRVQYLYIFLILVLYIGFHDGYRTEYIDNAWTLSWAYDYWIHGSVIDTVGGYGEYSGTTLFSRTAILIYGFIQQFTGWDRSTGYSISTFFLLAGAGTWFLIFRRLGYSVEISFSCFLLMLVMEAYFGMGHKIRVDATTFFFATGAFYLFIRGSSFFAGLVSLIAFENHPMGFITFFYILAYLISRREEISNDLKGEVRDLLFLAGGVIVGCGYYLLFHAEYLHLFTDVLESQKGGNTFAIYYFFARYSWRHLPELVVILGAFGWFLYKGYFREDRFILPFLICCFSATFLSPRGNYHYIVYFYPTAILLCIYTVQRMRRLRWLLIVFLCFQIPQYGYLFWKQRNYDHEAYLYALKTHVPEAAQIIYGNPSGWFAFQDRDYRFYSYFSKNRIVSNNFPDFFITIENQDSRERELLSYVTIQTNGTFEKTLLHEFSDYLGQPIRIWSHSRMGSIQPQS